MSRKVQELSSEKTELLAKAVDRQDHGGCLNAALWRGDENAVAIIDFDNGRVFIQRDIIGQVVGKAADKCSRV